MKTTSRLAFGLLSIFLMAQFAQGLTTLGIVRTNNQVILYWSNPGQGTNCVLTSAGSLASSGWGAATDAVPVNYSSKTALAVSNSAPNRLFRLSLVPPASDGMALIPAGTFLIGNTLPDTNDPADAIPTNVYLSAFYMDSNLVDYAEWESVYSYAASHGYSFTNSGSGKTLNQAVQPVQSIDWYDAVKWCNARSQQAGLAPVYFTDSAFTQLYTNGETNLVVYANWQAAGYRLPTEAEWEKAARGGLSALRFPWGNTISESLANYDVNPEFESFPYDMGPVGFNPLGDVGAPPFTTPVGSFAPNGYGLYDMAGNLNEWCWDWYDATLTDAGSPYAGGANPHGTASSPVGGRILRGGSWIDIASALRCGNRGYFMPYDNTTTAGFRCVRKQ